MAKRKSAPKKSIPPQAPQSLGAAVVQETVAQITGEMARDYAALIMTKDHDTLTKTQRLNGTRALASFAAVAFAFYQWTREGK